MEKKLKIMTHNLENFFVSPNDPSDLTNVIYQKFEKPIYKLKALAQTIIAQNPDVLALCEVGGEESLHNFNKFYLDDKYYISVIEGNSNRGIEIGYLIKKELPFNFKHLTHKNRPIDFLYKHEATENEHLLNHNKPIKHTSHTLSRDIAELRVFNKENNNSDPILIILLVHLKSQHDSDNIDPKGRDRREAEFKFLVDTYNILDQRYDKKVPIIITGDFNGIAVKNFEDPEFKYIYANTELDDILEILNIPEEKRETFVYFDRQREKISMQLDYIFIPPLILNNIDKNNSGIVPLLDDNCEKVNSPNSLHEKYSMPSDHFPIAVTLNFNLSK